MSARVRSPESAVPAPVAQFPAHVHAGHALYFYKEDGVLLADLGRFIGSALAAGDAAVVVATQAHRDGLASLLSSRGLDVDRASKQGRFIALDAAETLSKFRVDGQLNRALFNDVIGRVILQAKSAVPGQELSVAVFGEMVALLWADGEFETAVQLEQLWNDLAKSLEFSLCCAYPMNSFCRDEDAQWFEKVDQAHTLAIPNETYTALQNEARRLRSIAELQQKAEPLHGKVSLRDSEERFQLLVEAVRDYAIFMLDTDGRVTSWNEGAERIKGYTASEIIGQHFSRFYPEEDLRAGKPQNELEIALRDGRVEDEGWRVRKDGSKFWATVVITAMKDRSGKHIGFSKVTKDNTERMLVLKALRDSRRELHDSEDSLRRLSLHLLRTQDEERRRIGRDLHDSLGQTLSVLKMKLDSLAGSIGLSSLDSRNQNIASCANLTEDCIKEVRTIAYLLYPPMLEEMGLKSAISWYVDGFSKRSGIRTTFEIDPEFARLPRHVETAIFRVLQESLTNVHRHSGSEAAQVRLFNRGGTTVLEIIDEGKGMPPRYSSESGQDGRHLLGVGLRGMEERMRQLGGALQLLSGPRGTTVIASVPLEAPGISAGASA